MILKAFPWALLLVLAFSCKTKTQESPMAPVAETKAHLSPEDRYGELFRNVQLRELFPDSKTFADATPKAATDVILEQYLKERNGKEFNLKDFVNHWFDIPAAAKSTSISDTGTDIRTHIEKLWTVLQRDADKSNKGSLLALPHNYIVPGGRFREIYYWDSYFTMLGLQVSGKKEVIKNMVDNFAYLINTYGFIPNGNRQYYLSRSQPPFFASMVNLLAELEGDSTLLTYKTALEKEHAFWMAGADSVSAKNPAIKHVVRLSGGEILNRYFDAKPEPRPESYREDATLAANVSNKKPQEIYGHLRAGAESGWDYSSRWFADAQYLKTIQTTDIVPVDLNALLYQMELTLARAAAMSGSKEQQENWLKMAESRKKALHKYCWDQGRGIYQDYQWKARNFTGVPSLATMYPLFFGMAAPDQAKRVCQFVANHFLKPGGVMCTENNTGQQWDAPNGWAPLQWITIQGARNYQQNALADSVKRRWVDLNVRVYKRTGKLTEKYNVADLTLEGGGGEYPNQDGFGWTNGVLLRLLTEQVPANTPAPKKTKNRR